MSLLPSCRDVAKILSESLDSGLPLGVHVRLHLSLCEACRRVRAQFTVLRHGAARSSDEGPPLSADAKTRLRRSLDAP